MNAEISVKDQIKKLVDLQKLDAEIYQLNLELKERPAVLEQLKTEFESKKAHLNTLEEQYKQMQVAHKDLELELQKREDDIAKANADLSQIKTNKEYTAKLTEIENVKADKSVFEEKILVSFDDTDKVNSEIAKEKTTVSEEEQSYLAKKKEAEDKMRVIEDRLKVLGSQKQQASVEVDSNILSRYEKIIGHKNGIAIVPVLANSCGGCQMKVTQQMINQIKMHQDIISCEMCNRILYLEDDM